ncbi:hypothetical protein [Actinoplanes regularis]|uniref:Lipoprotein n=1 Tax=Actinoplanes regularis TaxID=52697 RepID=A0A239IUW6_9ACTN|nr:hypothetical protein [Actinoplanes regularis]GIE91585.1 hypothetical protein Are01nite_80650 [Actinoplanes regularis]SNS97440.1 hypothetical protein SAMN06264365_13124 [Actinoplanes regularis]
MTIRRLRYTLMAAVTTLTLAACAGEDKSLQPTATKAQAVQRVEELVHEAFGQLPSGATLKINVDEDSLPCDDATDGGPAGRIFAEKRYLIVPPGTGAWPTEQIIPTLVTFWQQKGYKVHTDKRSEPEPRYSVETPDGYFVTANAWSRGDHLDITLSSDSPCIWENGTPDPQ